MNDRLILYLTPLVKNAQERESATARLATLDLASRQLHPLATLAPGTQAASVSGDALRLAWVETSATDLAGHGWKLHLTQVVTGEDTVVAVDPGLTIESDRLNAHIPLTSLSSAGLLYTILVPGTSGPDWELRLRSSQTRVIARLENAALRRFALVASDETGAAWIEAVRSSTTGEDRQVSARDWTGSGVSTKLLSARPYGLRSADGQLLVATDRGVMTVPRQLNGPITAIGPTRLSESLGLLGSVIVALDSTTHEVFAIDRTTASSRNIDTGVTVGPVQAPEFVAWYRPSGAGNQGEVVIGRLAGH
jgi:hypothetical protein